MARETAAQKKLRIQLLLMEYDAKNREANKLATVIKGMKEQIREIPAGHYGDVMLNFGASKEIFDQKKAKELLTEAGLEIPTTKTQPSIVVSYKG